METETSIRCSDRYKKRESSFSSNETTIPVVAAATITTTAITTSMAGINPAPLEQEAADTAFGEALDEITISCIPVTTVAGAVGVVGAGLTIYIGIEVYRNWKKSNASTTQEDITEEDRQVKYEINGLDGFLCRGETRLEDHDQVNLKAVTQSCDLESGKEYFVTVTHTNGKTIIKGKKLIIP